MSPDSNPIHRDGRSCGHPRYGMFGASLATVLLSSSAAFRTRWIKVSEWLVARRLEDFICSIEVNAVGNSFPYSFGSVTVGVRSLSVASWVGERSTSSPGIDEEKRFLDGSQWTSMASQLVVETFRTAPMNGGSLIQTG